MSDSEHSDSEYNQVFDQHETWINNGEPEKVLTHALTLVNFRGYLTENAFFQCIRQDKWDAVKQFLNKVQEHADFEFFYQELIRELTWNWPLGTPTRAEELKKLLLFYIMNDTVQNAKIDQLKTEIKNVK